MKIVAESSKLTPQGRMHSRHLALLVMGLLITFSFFPNNSFGQRSKDPKPHHEDLTVHRLALPDLRDTVVRKAEVKSIEALPPANAVTEKVNTVLDSIARFNKSRMFTDGFTIQIYSGLKRDEAMETKKKLADEASEFVSDLQYIQPKWRVKTGSYYSRLEAQRDLYKLKRIFPNAILIPEKVAVK